MNNLIYNMLSHEDNNKFRRCKIIYNTVNFLDAEQVYNRPLLPLFRSVFRMGRICRNF